MSSSLSSSSSSSLSSSAPPPPPVEQPTASAEDSLYAADEAKLTALREAKPWTQDPKYMKKVRIGPSAAMKMLQHTYSGVERGIKAGGKPIEVMGLLFGRPNTEEENAFVVTDAFPLPIEGFETRVIADDMDVQNYMISLQETLEELYGLKERFMGWYHSHPFDVNEQWSHCYLSNTDLSTQLAWQRSEDPHGNPWLAIVVDPLRSLAKNHPEFAAFRAYPPEYAPPANETPDGKLVDEESKRVEQWGACWNRYYKLDVEYFMSTQAKAVIGILSKQYTWISTLGSTPMNDRDYRERVSERIEQNVTSKLEAASASMSHGMGSRMMGGDSDKGGSSAFAKPVASGKGLAVEAIEGQITQLAKKVVFD